jgi:hypothetical protein
LLLLLLSFIHPFCASLLPFRPSWAPITGSKSWLLPFPGLTG